MSKNISRGTEEYKIYNSQEIQEMINIRSSQRCKKDCDKKKIEYFEKKGVPTIKSLRLISVIRRMRPQNLSCSLGLLSTKSKLTTL